jgi:hypothetical protein
MKKRVKEMLQQNELFRLQSSAYLPKKKMVKLGIRLIRCFISESVRI